MEDKYGFLFSDSGARTASPLLPAGNPGVERASRPEQRRGTRTALRALGCAPDSWHVRFLRMSLNASIVPTFQTYVRPVPLGLDFLFGRSG